MEVGRLVAAQGLRGELRVLPMSDFPERFTRPGPRWLRSRQGEVRAVRLLTGRQLPGRELYVVRLEGCDDRSAAEALVGHHLLVDAADRPPLEPGEFHLLDLVGLEVRLLPQGNAIGTVTDLIHGGNDLLEVELSDGGRRLLIPFVEVIVPEVHLEQGWIGLTPPPGLLEL
jgi:16S rRNA processing protein RimM